MSSKPFSLYERMLAGRYLRAKRAHGGVAMTSIISIVSVMLAVAVLIVTMSVMNGFRETLLSRILGVNGHVFIDTRGMPLSEIDRLAALAREAPNVASVAPLIEEQALATSEGVAAGVIVRGLAREDFERLTLVTDSLRPGSSTAEFQGVDAPTLMIGDGLAAQLGVAEGMAISILSPQGAVTPFGLTPRRKAFMVGGVFDVGMAEVDAAFVYMPIEQARILFNRGDSADRLEVRVEDPDRTTQVIMALHDRLGPEVTIFDWRAQSQGLADALVVERNVMGLILGMIVAIASLTIVAGLVMLVKNKSRDIAILRTMGATRGGILRVFLMCGAVIGFVGTLAGATLGLSICFFIGPLQDFLSSAVGFDIFPGSVYSLDALPAKVEWHEVATVITFSTSMALLWSVLAAVHASRLDPVEALRYE